MLTGTLADGWWVRCGVGRWQTLGVIRAGLLAFDFGFTLAPVFATAVEGARNGAGAEFTHLFLVDHASQVRVTLLRFRNTAEACTRS